MDRCSLKLVIISFACSLAHSIDPGQRIVREENLQTRNGDEIVVAVELFDLVVYCSLAATGYPSVPGSGLTTERKERLRRYQPTTVWWGWCQEYASCSLEKESRGERWTEKTPYELTTSFMRYDFRYSAGDAAPAVHD
jgi:hypothetical protein